MRPSSLLVAFVPVLAGACAVLALGCGRPGMGMPIPLNGDPSMGELSAELAASRLITQTVGTETVVVAWESSPWSDGDPMTDPWMSYPPHGLLEISHPLGRTPVGVLVYISFTQDGTTPAMAAGELARIVEVTDEVVTVWNDTNGVYYARVVIF